MSQTDWNAVAYDDLSDPQFEWGMAVLETLQMRGDERVLDAGCGSGRLTEELLGRVPAGAVVALDSSPQMLEQARQRLSRFGQRVEFVHASLQDFALADFKSANPVDGIFSNAVFHWVPDHAAMFRCLHAALQPGGWLVAQFGGVGNLARAHRRADEVAKEARFKEYLAGVEYGPHFEDTASTRQRMEAAGFRVSEAKVDASTKATVAPMRHQGQDVALMVVGVGAMIVGGLVGNTAGTIIIIGGAGMALFGLYHYLE